jgi:hypothetical protein
VVLLSEPQENQVKISGPDTVSQVLIPATQEAENGRIVVPSQSRQKSTETVSNNKLGIVAGICYHSYSEGKNRRLVVHANLGKRCETLCEK